MTFNHVSNDDYGRLVALLDERRRMFRRHRIARKRPDRPRMTLAEKLAEDRQMKDELAELNAKIDELMNQGVSQ